jgi:hypothetical protein
VLSEPLTTIGMRQYKLNSLIDLVERGVAFPQNCFIGRRSYFETKGSSIYYCPGGGHVCQSQRKAPESLRFLDSSVLDEIKKSGFID